MTHYKIVSRFDLNKVLYEGEADSLKDLIGTAVKKGADLRGAFLRGADLRGADLQGTYLRGADLRGADLRGADLRGADLQGYKIETAAFLNGLYSYVVIPFVTESDEKRIVMGCYNRSLAEWESDFWNNPSEFLNDGSEKSRLRLFAFNVAKQWLAEFASAIEEGPRLASDTPAKKIRDKILKRP